MMVKEVLVFSPSGVAGMDRKITVTYKLLPQNKVNYTVMDFHVFYSAFTCHPVIKNTTATMG